MDISITNSPAIADSGTGTRYFDGAGTSLTTAVLFERDIQERLRESLKLSIQTGLPNLALPGGYSQTRRNIIYSVPYTLDDESVSVATIRTAFACSPELNATQKTSMLSSYQSVLLELVSNSFLTDGSFS